MTDVVYARASAVLAHGGHRIAVSAGDPWDAADPLVRRYPDMFTRELAYVRVSTDPRGYREVEAEPPVERGTRAPGERRPTRRRRADG